MFVYFLLIIQLCKIIDTFKQTTIQIDELSHLSGKLILVKSYFEVDKCILSECHTKRNLSQLFNQTTCE